MDFTKLKLVVFDLDGTLYEDTQHFDFYAQTLKNKLEVHKQGDFARDYRLVLTGEHALRMGRVYDVKSDLILVQKDGWVREAYQWDGTPLTLEKVKELYPQPISLNMQTMISVGDLWWVPSSIAGHYGLPSQKIVEAFMETRNYMMSDDFQMKPVIGLKEAIEKIAKNQHVVLMTNSPQKDSEVILKKLGLEQVFHEYIFEAQKPLKTEERLKELKNRFGIAFDEIVSIGDNWINEIQPARQLGCATIYINPHGLGSEKDADIIVREIKEVVALL